MKSHKSKSGLEWTPDIRSQSARPLSKRPEMFQRAPQRPIPQMRRPSVRKLRGQRWPLPLVIAIDVLLIGVGLILFALFHHVLPQDVGRTGIVLPQQSTSASHTLMTQSTALAPSTAPTTVTTASASSISGSITTGGTTSGITTPVTAPSGTTAAGTSSSSSQASAGLFAEKFRDKFTEGAVERAKDRYRSAHVSVTIRKVETGKVAYTVSDIYVSDIRYFRTAFASGKYARGITETVLGMARENQAITAISGDYYGVRDRGIVIRNGVLYRDKLYKDVLIMNNDGSMQTFTAGSFNVDTILKQGAWQGWSFGPMLLKDGQPMVSFNSDLEDVNPRGAVGYYEPGHYCFVLVDGRQPGYSDGMTLQDLSRLFYDLGCKVAYNLDGGQSAVLTFQNMVANSPYNGGRKISDILYISDN